MILKSSLAAKMALLVAPPCDEKLKPPVTLKLEVYGEYANAWTPRPVGPMFSDFIESGSNLPSAMRFAVRRNELTIVGPNNRVSPIVNACASAFTCVPRLRGLWFRSNDAGVTMLSSRYRPKIEWFELNW